MSRQPRLVLPEIPLHITQRGNNRQTCFFGQSDFLAYLDLLRNAASQAACHIHAYVLMTNHIHLLITPTDEHGPATLMKSLSERYVRYVNRRHARTGTLWDGRYRSCLVQSELYLMVCQRYIELNPVRAGLVSHPIQYPWSSYRCNAGGEQSGLISPHELYCRLGNDTVSRECAYRALFDEVLGTETLDQVRHAMRGGLALGSQSFTDRMGILLAPPPGSDQMVQTKWSDPVV